MIGIQRANDRGRRTMRSRTSGTAGRLSRLPALPWAWPGLPARREASRGWPLVIASGITGGRVLRRDHPGRKAQCHQRHHKFGSRFHCCLSFRFVGDDCASANFQLLGLKQPVGVRYHRATLRQFTLREREGLKFLHLRFLHPNLRFGGLALRRNAAEWYERAAARGKSLRFLT